MYRNLIGVLLLSIGAGVSAAPVLHEVSSGSATVSSSGTNTLVSQQSDVAVLEWNSFNVGVGQSVNFLQPNTQSLAVNNIVDASPSQILGTISANGRLVLLNASGFYFGAGSVISASYFVAAAAQLKDVSINGNQVEIASYTDGSLVALGSIEANEISLMAARVSVAGSIKGDVVSLRGVNELIVSGVATGAESIDLFGDVVSIGGSIAGGTISLSGGSILVSSSGIVSGEEIDLYSEEVILSGSYSASVIAIDGMHSVSLFSADVVGDTITIGGSVASVFIDIGTVINADGASGGSVIINSAIETVVYGEVRADGLIATGGFIELSSKGRLVYNPVLVSVAGILSSGTIVIDPTYIVISDDPVPVSSDIFLDLISILAVSGDRVGTSVALSDSHILVGAPALGAGRAFLYDLNNSSWSDVSTLGVLPTLTNGADFGYAVALSDTHALIGAPAMGLSTETGEAYVYEFSTFTWTVLSSLTDAPTLANSDNFGYSVALNNAYALIGAPAEDNGANSTGSAYLYRLDASTVFDTNCLVDGNGDSAWCSLILSSLSNNDGFGYSVALNDTYGLIGAPGDTSDRGNAYLYRIDGNDCVDGSSNSYCDLSSTTNEPITGLASSDGFGSSVDLNDEYAIVGTPGVSSSRGDAMLYRLDNTSVFDSTCLIDGTNTGSAWCTLSSSVTQPVTALVAGSLFGSAVSLNRYYALFGTPGVSSNRGNGYLYRLDSANTFDANCGSSSAVSPWCSLDTLPDTTVSGLLANSDFGTSVSISDSHFVIGAPGVSVAPATDVGRIYLVDFKDFFAATVFTTTQIDTMLTSGDVRLEAELDITIADTITHSGLNRLTLVSGGSFNQYFSDATSNETSGTLAVENITLQSTGDISLGTEENPVLLSQSSGTTGSIILSSNSDIYIQGNGSLRIGAVSGTTVSLQAAGGDSASLEFTDAISAEKLRITTIGEVTLPALSTAPELLVVAGDNVIVSSSITISLLSISAAGSIQIDEDASLEGDSITLDGQGISIAAPITGKEDSTINITSYSDIQVMQPIVGPDFTFIANGNVVFEENSTISVTNLSISSGGSTSFSNNVIIDTLQIQSGANIATASDVLIIAQEAYLIADNNIGTQEIPFSITTEALEEDKLNLDDIQSFRSFYAQACNYESACARLVVGSVYISVPNTTIYNQLVIGEQVLGTGTLVVINQNPPPIPEPIATGFLADIIDPILELFGSECTKESDDVQQLLSIADSLCS